MLNYMLPFTRTVDLRSGTIPDAPVVQTRRISDLKGLFVDKAAEAALLAENPIVYQVYEATQNPEMMGHLRYSTTVIHPGKVGEEFFMTKGHYHALGDRTEFYYGLMGEGYLLLQTPNGEINAQRVTPGAMVYVPPYWGHRSMNTGKDNFVLLAVYPADAGYDYRTIAKQGFAAIVIERNHKPEIVPNPYFMKQR